MYSQISQSYLHIISFFIYSKITQSYSHTKCIVRFHSHLLIFIYSTINLSIYQPGICHLTLILFSWSSDVLKLWCSSFLDYMQIGFTITMQSQLTIFGPVGKAWMKKTIHVVVSFMLFDFYILIYVIKFVSDLQQVSGFLRVIWLTPPIKLTATI